MAAPGLGSRAVVYVAEGYNFHIGTLSKFRDIAFALATGTNAGYAQLITWGYMSASNDMTGNNGESRHAQGTGFDEFSPLNVFVRHTDR